ncbi:MAG: hypothetical protein NC219_10595 [Prevotella sp.]|nr:hypothetical protein [Prevotella sp.]
MKKEEKKAKKIALKMKKNGHEAMPELSKNTAACSAARTASNEHGEFEPTAPQSALGLRAMQAPSSSLRNALALKQSIRDCFAVKPARKDCAAQTVRSPQTPRRTACTPQLVLGSPRKPCAIPAAHLCRAPG